MEKFPIAAMGTRKDGKKWALIERENPKSDVIDVAFVTLKAATKLKVGAIIELTDSKIERLKWS
jgi:hypothetical protein